MAEPLSVDLPAPDSLRTTPLSARFSRESERALIRAAQAGSADAAEALAARYWDGAHQAAYMIVRDAAAAEDIAQDALVAALQALGGFNRARRFRPWLHRIVVNRSLDWLNKRDRRREVSIDLASDQLALGASDSSTIDVGEALERLDPQTRAIVVLRCLLDYRPREIAGMLGCSSGAVRTRLSRALSQLRNLLGEEHDAD